eukprot:gene33498-40530_t
MASAFEFDSTTKKPIDEQVQATLKFVHEHEELLCRIQEANVADMLNRVQERHTRTIQFASEPVERVLPTDIFRCHENEQIRKALTALVYLGDEIAQLKDLAETKFYRPLLMFGQLPMDIPTDKVPQETLNSPGKKEQMMGKFLPFLQELSNFVDRCYAVALNLVQQLSGLTNQNDFLYRAVFNSTHLMCLYHSLANLLAVLISLDCIIQQNEVLLDSWNCYKSMIAYSRADPAAFGTTDEQIAVFERLLVSVDQTLMIGEIFKGCVEQNFEELEAEEDGELTETLTIRQNTVFLEGELVHCMRMLVENCLPNIGTNNELNERSTLLGCLGLYALYRQLLPSHIAPDAKLHKLMWGIQKVLPCIIVGENSVLYVGEFIMQHAPLDAKKLDPPVPDAYRKTYIQQFDAALGQRTQALTAQCKAWMVLAESRLQACLAQEVVQSDKVTLSTLQVLDVYASIFLKGLSLIKRTAHLAKSALVLHSNLQVPLSKSNLFDIATLLELTKALAYVFTRKDSVIAEYLVHINHGIMDSLYAKVSNIKLKLEASKKMENRLMVLHAVAVAFQQLLTSTDTWSACRQVSACILAEILQQAPVHVMKTDKDGQKIYLACSKLVALANLVKDVRAAGDTSFVYFHTSIMQPIVASIYTLPTEASRLHYLYNVYQDGVHLLEGILHHEQPQKLIKNYYIILYTVLQDEIIHPLCKDIETDLRLHIHTKHLDHMVAVNPKSENLRPLKPFLDMAPLHFLGRIIYIKQSVTHYLDMNFYNLTTVALHDWKTYSDMRSLASEKFGLTLMDNFLPMGSLDQGLDVLQIMRNIHIFVSRFTYNMNMQQFVEYRPDKSSKHLNTIKIQSIAASIRQHGLGVLNTTVNFTYQFLSSKFRIFSQFLFDDHIKAHLSREHRWFKKHKNEPEVNNMYPHERALKFVQGIKKLGVNDANKSFLDQFRILITEIGNALGYVRMVRSASMYYCSEAVKYLPDFEDIIPFADYAGAGRPEKEIDGTGVVLPAIQGVGLSAETVRAA